VADVFETHFRENRPIPRNSLHFSLRPGNLARQEIVNFPHGSRHEAECREWDMLERHLFRVVASALLFGVS
jgi:hypothetical protein